MTTAQQRRIIKAYASSRDMKYRITSSGEVHMYGVMPNTSEQGWWLFAYTAEEAVDQIQPEY